MVWSSPRPVKAGIISVLIYADCELIVDSLLPFVDGVMFAQPDGVLQRWKEDPDTRIGLQKMAPVIDAVISNVSVGVRVRPEVPQTTHLFCTGMLMRLSKW